MAGPHPRGGCLRHSEGGPAAFPPQCRQRLSGTGSRKMKLRIVLALFLSLAALTPAFAADIKALDLGKKAEVWFSEDHTVPIVAFSITLPAGSAYDPANKAGLASFAAALIDEGAGNMDSRAFQEALADHAIQLRANVERDDMVISVVTLTENAPLAMHLLQTALIHPRFDAEAVTRVRAQMIQG